jgi:hypothetical protein
LDGLDKILLYEGCYLSDRGDNYVQEFIITFGFLEGLWFRLGYSPEGTIVDAIAEVIKTINPDYSWLWVADN